MSVPSSKMVCQLAIALALLVVSASIWKSAQRYQFFTLQNGSLLRGDTRSGVLARCYYADTTRSSVSCE